MVRYSQRKTGALKAPPPPPVEKFEREPLTKGDAPVWREVRQMLAAKLYGAGRLSSERAARLADIPHVEFLLTLGFYKVFPLLAELNELEQSRE